MGTALCCTLLALFANLHGTAALEPCALLTKAEVAAAMDATAGTGSPDKAHGGNTCHWFSPSKEKSVFVTIVQAGDLKLARTLGGKPVHGLGDEAVWATGSLFIRKGLSCVQVGLYLNDNSMKAMDPEIIALGQAVAGRM